jgi:hypothetical protein
MAMGTLWSCTTQNTDQETLKSTELPVNRAKLTYSTVDLSQYPSSVISNETVQMQVFHPDPDKGIYRATRFDWSGVIGSVRYADHEYFGYWKDTHDPAVHEDLPGPVEGYLEPGLGYREAKPGEGFVRIGVGVIEKLDEPDYQWAKTYNILDHGNWVTKSGKDWISFNHLLESDFGYSYSYTKTIRLKTNGFIIEHELENTGDLTIETDQFNHNFFMIDGEISGPSFTVDFPYNISTEDDLKDLMRIQDNQLQFIQPFNDTSLFMTLTGYGQKVDDHQVTVMNNSSGAGVRFSVDQPLYRMCFWACETTLCPENFIWISAKPGERMNWSSDYTLLKN